MKCTQVQARWMALLDRVLDEAVRIEVEEHRGACAACESEYQALVAAENLLQRHARGRVAAPPGLIDRMMTRLEAAPKRTVVRELVRLAAVAGVLLGILTLVVDRVSYQPVVEKMNAQIKDTREYVTEELPRVITSSVLGAIHE